MQEAHGSKTKKYSILPWKTLDSPFPSDNDMWVVLIYFIFFFKTKLEVLPK